MVFILLLGLQVVTAEMVIQFIVPSRRLRRIHHIHTTTLSLAYYYPAYILAQWVGSGQTQCPIQGRQRLLRHILYLNRPTPLPRYVLLYFTFTAHTSNKQ